MAVRYIGTPARSFPGPATPNLSTYFHPITILGGTSAMTTIQANRLYYLPHYLPGLTVTKISLEVSTLAAGNVRMGLYTNAAGAPGSLISGTDVGAISTGTTGVKENTFSSAVTLPDDWVWAACLFDAAPQCIMGTAANTGILGSSGINVAGTSRGYYAAQAYGALPAAAPTPTVTGQAPAVCLRI